MQKVSVAFGGGAVLGAAHVGVVKAILEKGLEIEAVSGTSIGSMIASLLAFGYDPMEVEQLAIEMNWTDISELSFSKYGLLSNEKLGKWVQKTIGDVKIEEAKLPLYIVATDIANGKKHILKEGSLATAIRASTCIPGIFKPVKWDDFYLVDGGIVENVPISPLKEHGEQKIIAIDLNSNRNFSPPSNIIDVLVNSFHLTLSSRDVILAKSADLLIAPDLSAFNSFDPRQTEALIEKGYATAVKALKGF